MFEKPEVLRIASSLASHAASRQATIARNVANADTPGYRAEDIADFAEVYRHDGNGALRATRNGHHLTSNQRPESFLSQSANSAALSPNGNSVSLETEMVKAVAVKREHDLALAIYGKSLSILRASLGRR